MQIVMYVVSYIQIVMRDPKREPERSRRITRARGSRPSTRRSMQLRTTRCRAVPWGRRCALDAMARVSGSLLALVFVFSPHAWAAGAPKNVLLFIVE